MKRTTTLEVIVGKERLKVSVRYSSTEMMRYEVENRHAKIVDKMHRALSDIFYAQYIKVK